MTRPRQAFVPPDADGVVCCVALDFGAGGSRAMPGRLAGHDFSVEEIRRFDGASLRQDGWTGWQVEAVYAGLAAGPGKARASGGDSRDVVLGACIEAPACGSVLMPCYMAWVWSTASPRPASCSAAR